jgi:hypothetical protein
VTGTAAEVDGERGLATADLLDQEAAGRLGEDRCDQVEPSARGVAVAEGVLGPGCVAQGSSFASAQSP